MSDLRKRLLASREVTIGYKQTETVFRNPDGPEAAARITALEAERDEAYARGRKDAAAYLEERAKSFPVGHEDQEKGASSYNWWITCARALAGGE